MKANERLIVALDVDTKEKALEIVETLKGDVRTFKIGFELFSSCGPLIVEEVKAAGCEVFLDLKFHDIPNTVAKAAAAVTQLGVFMLNVHALGGYDMMKKAAEAVGEAADKSRVKRPKVIGVTVLTSMDARALKNVGVADELEHEVLRLALLAEEAGLDGVVASSLEAKMLRGKVEKDFLIVTPGVRPSWAAKGDQKRIATPGDAVSFGADYIVVGRPITEADDMAAAARKVIEEIG